jgi:hypothetical protein
LRLHLLQTRNRWHETLPCYSHKADPPCRNRRWQTRRCNRHSGARLLRCHLRNGQQAASPLRLTKSLESCLGFHLAPTRVVPQLVECRLPASTLFNGRQDDADGSGLQPERQLHAIEQAVLCGAHEATARTCSRTDRSASLVSMSPAPFSWPQQRSAKSQSLQKCSIAARLKQVASAADPTTRTG